jgi:hypothetical protein
VRPAGRGFFPLDKQLALWEQHWSERVAKHATQLGAVVDFETAEEIMQGLGQIAISDSSIWRRVAKWGAKFQAREAMQAAQATALPNQQEIVAGEAKGVQRKAVALDGAMVHIRTEGWKEVKIGCVGDIELRPTLDKQTQEWLDLAHTVHNTYVGYLGGPEAFGQRLWAEAKACGWSQAADTIALGDGAAWVWNLVKDHFHDSRQCVDWYHATSHLMQAASLIHGEGTPQARQWFHDRDTLLFEGQADQIAEQIQATAKTCRKVASDLKREAGYFADNQRRMQYLELREEGFPIGSGMVESGCKQYQARFKGPGMRWSRAGFERLLPIRSAILSRRFDETWTAVYPPPLI